MRPPRPGAATRLATLALSLLALAPAAGAATLTVAVSPRDLPAGGAVAVRVAAESSAAAPAVTAVVQAPGRAVLELEDGVAYRVTAAAPGWWAPARSVITVRGGDVREDVALWPAGTVAGTIAVPAGAAAPAALSLAFRGVAGTPAEDVEGEVPCRVTDGSFTCEPPAAALDLELRAPGYATVFRFATGVAAGAVTPLGRAALVPGASVVGFVRPSRPTGRPCRVEAAVAVAALDPAAPQAPTARVATGERGLFQMRAVPPGRYLVTATCDALAPAVSGPVTVVAGTETRLTAPLVPREPVSVSVVVAPPLDPGGRPWRLTLLEKLAAPGAVRDVVRDLAVEPPAARLTGLSPGRYVLQLGDGSGSRWLEEERDLRRDGEVVDLVVGEVPVRGRVRLGGRGVPARLIFGGLHGAVRIRLDADDSGEVEGLLPRDGAWPVTVGLLDPFVERTLPSVNVSAAGGVGLATFVIDLPDTAVTGEVVDGAGAGVGGAIVTPWDIEGGEQPGSVRTGRGGRFELHGVRPGTLLLEASRAGRRSPAVEVTVEEGGPAATVRLVLSDLDGVEGLVLGPGGPVAGAEVVAQPVGAFALGARAVSDQAGRFTLRLPAGAREALLVVTPPGHGVVVGRVALPDGAPLRVTVPPLAATGTLTLALPEELPPGTMPLLVHDGGVAGVAQLAAWAAAQGLSGTDGDRTVVPGLAPGAWSLCTVPVAEFAAVAQGLALPARCRTAVLSPGSVATLELPGPSPSR